MGNCCKNKLSYIETNYQYELIIRHNNNLYSCSFSAIHKIGYHFDYIIYKNVRIHTNIIFSNINLKNNNYPILIVNNKSNSFIMLSHDYKCICAFVTGKDNNTYHQYEIPNEFINIINLLKNKNLYDSPHNKIK